MQTNAGAHLGPYEIRTLASGGGAGVAGGIPLFARQRVAAATVRRVAPAGGPGVGRVEKGYD